MSGAVPQGGAQSSLLRASDIDFSSTDGLKSLLATLRGTPMVRADYNQARDLIFSYKQKGEDPAAKTALLDLLRTAGVMSADAEPAPTSALEPQATTEPAPAAQATAPAAAETPVTSSPTGRVRPAPQFGATTPAPAPTEPAPTNTEAPTPPPSPEPEPAPTPEPPATPEPSPAPAPEAPTQAVSEPASSGDDPLERIKAIKHEVNGRVGNPINLIDSHNEVGREYMTALLEAMKAVNAGSDTVGPMGRLETAYQTVLSTLDATPATNQAAETATNEVAESTPSEASAPDNEAASKPAAVPEPVAEPAPAPTSAVAISPAAKLGYQASEPSAQPATPEPAVTPLTSMAEPTAAPAPEPVIPTPEPAPVSTTPPAQSTPEPAATQTPAASSAETIVPTTAMHSVAEEKKSQDTQRQDTIVAAREAQEAEEAKLAAMDPLVVPDVTNGLNHLLSEWKLFKSSGLFGTGPSGMEHPLYQQLAPMQMSTVIAGRFEGATPEVKQSIADYMNGWRYEEGIVHEHGETFEHYLRRVIAAILKKQADAPAA